MLVTVLKEKNGKVENLKFKYNMKNKPSSGTTKSQRSSVAKAARAGKDIGKKGKTFEKIAAKASKKYGSEEAGKKVAAAAMWKNIKRK